MTTQAQLVLCWRDDEEWAGLTGHELLREAGYAFGAVDLWREEQLLHVAEAAFGPSNLDRHAGHQGRGTRLAASR